VVAGDIIAGCDLHRFLNKSQGNLHLSVPGIDEVAGNHDDIRPSLPQQGQKIFIFPIVNVRQMRDPETVKALRQPGTGDGIPVDLQSGICPYDPNNQGQQQNRSNGKPYPFSFGHFPTPFLWYCFYFIIPPLSVQGIFPVLSKNHAALFASGFAVT
jgi:hypothetical protein